MSCEWNTKNKANSHMSFTIDEHMAASIKLFLIIKNYVNANAVQLYCIIHVYLNNTYMPVVCSVYHCQ